jgi:hypothetical protein
MQKIETISASQWAEIYKMRQSIYDLCATPTNHALAEQAVEALYANANKKKPNVIFCKSPIEGLFLFAFAYKASDNLGANLGANLRANLRDNLWDNLWDNLGDFYWDKSRLGFFEGGEIAGLTYDQKSWAKYKLIVQNLDIILPFKEICIVCERPTKIGWHDAGGIHCEDGPAVEYADGYCLWALEGYRVPEKVVMAPETQTLEEIHNEENEEIRRIRINRFGWSRYISESHGEVLDVAMPRYGGMESLIKTSMGNVLCT